MIKLLLITLLCVAVFATSSADSPADEMNQGWMGPAKAVADMAEYAMAGQGRSLVRRAAQPDPPKGPPPNGPPPSSQLGFRSLVRRAAQPDPPNGPPPNGPPPSQLGFRSLVRRAADRGGQGGQGGRQGGGQGGGQGGQGGGQ